MIAPRIGLGHCVLPGELMVGKAGLAQLGPFNC